MARRRDAVLDQINHTIGLLQTELAEKLGEIETGTSAPSVGTQTRYPYPSRRSTPTDGYGQTQGRPAYLHSAEPRIDGTPMSGVPNPASGIGFSLPPHYPSINVPMDLPDFSVKKPAVMPDYFDGQTSLDDWLTHLDLCSKINGWTEEQKTNFLAVKLKGPALQLYTDLPEAKKHNYVELEKSLQERFSPRGQAELYRAQLKARVRRKGETLPELASNIRRLVVKAYPDVSVEFRDELGRDYFLDALDSPDIRIQVRRLKPKTLSAAVSLATEEEALRKLFHEL